MSFSLATPPVIPHADALIPRQLKQTLRESEARHRRELKERDEALLPAPIAAPVIAAIAAPLPAPANSRGVGSGSLSARLREAFADLQVRTLVALLRANFLTFCSEGIVPQNPAHAAAIRAS